MTRDEFMSELEFIFNVAEGSLQAEIELVSLKSWDSIGMLSVITLLKEAGSKAKVDQLRESKTIGDLLKLVEEHLE
jgi:acyl carrier protein